MLPVVSVCLAIALLVIARLAVVCRTSLKEQRHTDALTGLPNRLGFEAILADYLKQNHPFSLVWIDLDGFRKFNEEHDYATGDFLLRQVGLRIRQCLRPGDAVARFGGDQFLVLLRGHDVTAGIMARILRNVKATAGVSLYPNHASGSSELLRLAETAMLRAKESSRGQPLNDPRSTEIARLIESALASDHFRLVYQPIVDANGEIVRMEALARIDDPVLGRVAPVEFIGVAEQTGLIHEVGDWILRKACRQARDWRDAGFQTQVTINLSPLQLASNQMADRILSRISECRLDGSAVTIHITGNVESPIPVERLRSSGVSVSSQGAGTCFNEIRIGEPFKTPADRRNRMMIARGIETPDQLDQARAAGCHLFQGYQIAPPLEPEDATEILRTGLFAGANSFVR